MESLFEALRRHSGRLGPTLGQAAFKRGLAVTNRDGSRRPIPISLTPVIVDAEEMRRRLRLSHNVCTAACKMARALLASERRELLLRALSPLERRIAERSGQRVQTLATARTDFFISNQAYALEVNATIPAMQGYSDIAATSFIETIGSYFGLSEREQQALIAQNGSNSRALYDALLTGAGKGKRPERIGILCRRNDAQISELEYLRQRFTGWGIEAELIFPDELEVSSQVTARGRAFPAIYRHLFVRRLEETPAPAVEQLFLNWPNIPAVLLNPPASQIEVKTTFALLSEAGDDPELASAAQLSAEELESIAQTVPWTRALRPGPTTIPGGDRANDLVAYVASHPDRFVLKRAWDYGGKAVFVGIARGEDSFRQRVAAAYGAPIDWASLCQRASTDPTGGGFVVQQLVNTRAESHILCTEDAVAEAKLFVDFSAYASVGIDPEPSWGGVCRGSTAQIVNIVGGGGVLPLLTTSVASALVARSKARPIRARRRTLPNAAKRADY